MVPAVLLGLFSQLDAKEFLEGGKHAPVKRQAA